MPCVHDEDSKILFWVRVEQSFPFKVHYLYVFGCDIIPPYLFIESNNTTQSILTIWQIDQFYVLFCWEFNTCPPCNAPDMNVKWVYPRRIVWFRFTILWPMWLSKFSQWCVVWTLFYLISNSCLIHVYSSSSIELTFC